MISRDAIYDFLDDVITNADASSALHGAVLFRNLRNNVDVATKVVRVDCVTGIRVTSDEPRSREANVRCTIQFYCLPDDVEEPQLDEAMDISFDMMMQAGDALDLDPGLDDKVCVSSFEEFETGYANIGSTRYGVTWLDGVINQAR